MGVVTDPSWANRILIFLDDSGKSTWCYCDSNGRPWDYASSPAGWATDTEAVNAARQAHSGAVGAPIFLVGTDPWFDG